MNPEQDSDFTEEKTIIRQLTAAAWLQKAGRPEAILAKPHPELDPRFCQFRSRELRLKYQRAAKKHLTARRQGGASLYMVTLINPDWISESAMKAKRARRIAQFIGDRLSQIEGGDVTLHGAIELDWCSGYRQPNQWRQTVHAVVATRSRDADLERLREALVIANTAAVYRTLVIKPVHDLDHALDYCFKGFSIDAVTERVSYRSKPVGDQSRVHSRSVRLKPAQQRQLIEHLAEVPLAQRRLKIQR